MPAPRNQVCEPQQTMRALRQFLSDTLATFLRLSACHTHISTSVEESFRHPSLDHLPYHLSPTNEDDKTVPVPTMSPSPYIFTPSSYLQSSFDVTLVEYSRLTGIDLITHPFAAIFDDDIHTVDMVVAAMQERAQPSGDLKMDSLIAGLMNHLKSIAHVMSLLSPRVSLSEHIDLRFSPAKAILTSIGVLLAVCSLFPSEWILMTLKLRR
ncbi:hypothetical protein BC827DRAFT_414697 [Russula dissimulans]|nr:hypothetical protein BC827DRAFT_414697 [Russula dissimulans]